jgi:phosphoribosylformylglycinamidine synthase
VTPEDEILVPEDPTESPDEAAAALSVLGSSEYAKVVLGGVWGRPPSLDLEAEAKLHKLLAALAENKLVYSARDISDGGLAVALAQSAFPLGIGAKVEQEQSLMAQPLFGLFSEPASTVLLTADAGSMADIESLAGKHDFFATRIGTTGGSNLEITVDRNVFISASLAALKAPWAEALKATLHEEVTA